jgi:hypothetical protein
MKSGLGKAALSAPEVAFADEQALAEQRADDEFRKRAFAQLGVIENEKLLYVVGPIEEDTVHAQHGHADNVAVLPGEAQQGAEGIIAHIQRESENGQTSRTGRRVRSVLCHAGCAKIISSTRNTPHKTS